MTRISIEYVCNVRLCHTGGREVACGRRRSSPSTAHIFISSPGMKGTRPQLKMFFKHGPAPADEGQISDGDTPFTMAMPAAAAEAAKRWQVRSSATQQAMHTVIGGRDVRADRR